MYWVRSTEYGVRCTEYGVLGTVYGVLDAEFGVLGTEFGVLGTEYGVLGAACSVLRTPYFVQSRLLLTLRQTDGLLPEFLVRLELERLEFFQAAQVAIHRVAAITLQHVLDHEVQHQID